MKTVLIRNAAQLVAVITVAVAMMLLAPNAGAQGGPITRNQFTTNQQMNATGDGLVPIWNNAAKKWSNGVLTASATNLPPHLTTETLTNLAATGVSPGGTNASAYIGSSSGKGTNTTLYGTLTVPEDIFGHVYRSDLFVNGDRFLVSDVGPNAYITESAYGVGDLATVTALLNQSNRVNNAVTNFDTRNLSFSGRITNSSTSGGGFWGYDSVGFISLSSANDYLLMSQPQGGIFGTVDGWGLGMGNGTPLIQLYTNLVSVTSDASFASHVIIGSADRYYFAADSGSFYLFDSVLGTAPILVSDVDSIVSIQAGLTVPAVAYGVSWDGSTLVPTMDAVYDKIESLSVVSGGGGPGSLPMASSQFSTNSIVHIINGAVVTNLSSRGLTIPSITASRVAVVNSSGNITNSQGVDLTEIEYLDGVTSAIQTQFGSKLSSSTNANQFAGVPLSIKNGAVMTNISLYGATVPNVTASRVAAYNSSGNLTNSQGVDLAELEFLDGVSSPIQTQFGSKLSSATNANQFAGVPLSVKDGALLTNLLVRGITLPALTTSRPAIIDASGNLTNATGTPDGTKFLRDDGTLAVPSGGTGSTNPVAFTAGSVGVSNYFGLGFTNTGSNAVQVIDCMGPQLVRSFINGDTTLVLTNMPAWTNAQYGGKLRLQVRHGSGTVTLASLHPINWGRPFFIAQGETNLLTIEFNGHELIGTLSHEPAEINTAYASVVEIDQAVGQSVVWNITNRVTGNLSLILTNPVSSRHLLINVIGEATGGTDRTVTLIPNTGSFVVNRENTTARTNSYQFTIQDGYAANIEIDTAKLTGTNLWQVKVDEYAYGEAIASAGSSSGGSTTNALPVTLAINNGTGSTNIVVDFWQLAQMSTNSVRVTLTANAGVVVTNIIDGKELVIDVVQDSTGNRTIAQSSVGGAPLRFGTDITGFGLSTNGTYIDHIKLRGVGTNAHVVGMIRGYAP